MGRADRAVVVVRCSRCPFADGLDRDWAAGIDDRCRNHCLVRHGDAVIGVELTEAHDTELRSRFPNAEAEILPLERQQQRIRAQ